MTWWRTAVALVVLLGLTLPALAQPSPDAGAETDEPPSFSEDPASRTYQLVVSLQDSFDDPGNGILPEDVVEPTVSVRRYLGGEYQIQKLNPQSTEIVAVDVPGIYGDASLTFDVRLVGDTFGRNIAAGCRRQADGSHYRLSIFPDSGQFLLARWDGATRLTLASDRSPAILIGNETNRIVLSCVGTSISVAINGVTVASVTDATYAEGRMWMGAYGSAESADARFDNLVVRRSELVQLTPTLTPRVSATPTITPTPTEKPVPATLEPSSTPTPTPTPAPQHDGSWGTGSGTGIPVSFNVTNDVVTSLTIAFAVPGTRCRLEGVVLVEPTAVTAAQPGRISFEGSRAVFFRAIGPLSDTSADGTVSVTLTGRFDSLTAASGTLEVRAQTTQSDVQCQGRQRGEWSAVRGGTGPNPEDVQRLVR